MKLPPVSDELASRFIDNPDNARKVLDLESLLPSIEKDGILQPVGAVEDGEFLRLVWGHRRVGCARLLGIDTVPCRVFRGMASGDVRRLALIENVARLNLKPSEESAEYGAFLKEGNGTARELAHLLGKTDGCISKKLAILRLIPELVRLIDGGLVPETSAPDLAKLDEATQREFAASISGPISREETEQRIGKRRSRKAERTYRLTRGDLSVVYGSHDLDALLAEIDELRKQIKKAQDEGWDFPTLAKVLRVRKPA